MRIIGRYLNTQITKKKSHKKSVLSKCSFYSDEAMGMSRNLYLLSEFQRLTEELYSK